MSGGHFDYDQYKIGEIAREIERLITHNNGRYSDETIERFREGVKFLRQAEIYAQRIDWLVSGDDSQESFHERLRKEFIGAGPDKRASPVACPGSHVATTNLQFLKES
ncbi:MAG: hypothetical protein UY48_C0003G0055 [Candidatus Gottesmanbacteria bacterium GW2011_GWB1_49_7]|uniref:Uncharacterized protein n=1 Tax=Candidatus Gottesmanbacteria bacterium GW2011_GWB1_49_7 TaxID=1618448 RepID=A0A0G1W3F6_9BACT|nr:MAG: hypothetical protein UY48_C0003G0055 [Candidatus Gottesmanbacteria bacterium GW2011_GWB1_49_7]